MLGLQSYWDASYSEDLANYQEHGHAGEIWWLYPFFFCTIKPLNHLKKLCYVISIAISIAITEPKLSTLIGFTILKISRVYNLNNVDFEVLNLFLDVNFLLDFLALHNSIEYLI
jgi:hypothetical protein